MRILLFITLIIVSLNTQAKVCITNVRSDANVRFMESNHIPSFFDELTLTGEELYQASMTCKELDATSNGLTVASIAMQSAAIYTACSGVGLPAAIYLELGVIALQVVDLVVTNLECEDEDTEAMIKAKVDQAVCQALSAQDIECQIPIKTKQL